MCFTLAAKPITVGSSETRNVYRNCQASLQMAEKAKESETN